MSAAYKGELPKKVASGGSGFHVIQNASAEEEQSYYPALQTVGRTLHNYQICFIVLANLVNWMGGFILL